MNANRIPEAVKQHREQLTDIRDNVTIFQTRIISTAVSGILGISMWGDFRFTSICVRPPGYCEILQEMLSLFLGRKERCKKRLQYLRGHAKISTGSIYLELPYFGNLIFDS